MSRCKRCNIEIHDNTIRCPLCRGVIEQPDYKPDANEAESTEKNDIGSSLMYPDVKAKMKKAQFALKLFICAAVVAAGICILVNYLVSDKLTWSLIVVAGLVYACFAFWYSFQRHTGHRTKMVILTFGAMILAVALDYIIGYKGWSVNIFVPGFVAIMDTAIFVLIIISSRWQNYIFMQIIMTTFSLVYLVTIPLDIVTWSVVAISVAAYSICILIGVILFGDKKAKNEIKRRFHV